MNDPINDMGDDKALDEYLAGGSAMSRRYRELGADAVPPELDRLVLQRARAEVARPSRAQAWRRWSIPVALAASVVLAVAILLETGVRQESALQQETRVPQEAAAQHESGTLLGATESERKSEIAREERGADSLKAAVPPVPRRDDFVMIAPVQTVPVPPLAAPAQPAVRNDVTPSAKRAIQADAPTLAVAPSPVVVEPQPEPQGPAHVQSYLNAAPASAAADKATESAARERDAGGHDDLSEVTVTGQRRALSGSGVGPRGTVPRPATHSRDEQALDNVIVTGSAVQAPAAESPPHDDPARWLEAIRQLRKDGKTQQADQEWEKFRAAFPDYTVAEKDLARPKR